MIPAFTTRDLTWLTVAGFSFFTILVIFDAMRTPSSTQIPRRAMKPTTTATVMFI
ncbi:MAG: hypothetical protein KAR40_05740 [Candidatus Sabulitectum sp.]|nr:hypothetical protein [Candidatus Sabulitectum sp.]